MDFEQNKASLPSNDKQKENNLADNVLIWLHDLVHLLAGILLVLLLLFQLWVQEKLLLTQLTNISKEKNNVKC